MKIKLKYDVREPYDRGLIMARGVAKEDLLDFIRPTSRLLQDPFDLDSIRQGFTILQGAGNANVPTLLLVDSDADGFCSAAILYQYLKEVYPDWEIEVAHHIGKQHGLEGLVDRYDMTDYELIILPDSGTNDDELIRSAPDTQFLIIDHHLREGSLDDFPENAVLINNQISEEYLNKSLSGGGVVWQFCRAMDKLNNTSYADKYIDLAAVSIIADIMDISKLENRYIVNKGIKELNNIFLQRLRDDATFQLGAGPLTPIGAAFYMIPNINSMCRMGEMGEKERMWMGFVEPEKMVQSKKRGAKEGDMVPVVTEAVRESRNVKARQRRMQEKMAELCEKRIIEEDLQKDKIMIITLDDTFNDMPSELNGLTATKLSNELGRPVLIGRENQYGELKGSIRGLPRIGIPSLKDFLLSSGSFNFVQGHDNAAGFSLPARKLEAVKQWIKENTQNIVIGENIWDVDFEADAFDDELKSIIGEMDKMKSYWGHGFEEPLISVTDIKVNRADIQVLGKKADTVKVTCNGVAYMFFRRNEDEVRSLIAHDSAKLNIVGRANLNEYYGRVTPQIFVTDYTIEDNTLAF